MFGKYKLTALIGRGGMGEVYEAYDTSKNRSVALKILPEQLSHDEQFRARFQRESHAAAGLQEPHIIPIHDWGEIDGNLFIDMRLVQGQDLHEALKSGPLEPARAVAIVAQVGVALDAAHAQGLIHRDIKPQNILVTPADFAYLVDFGIAETVGETRLTVAGSAIGSFCYMAPERFEDLPATPAVDVYSLAGVLYEALTGDTPFGVSSMEKLIAAHVSAPPPRPSAVNHRVPPSFDDVIARGMAKEPDDRYGSAGALGRAAERALRSGAQAPSTGPMAVTQEAVLTAPPSGPHPVWQGDRSWQATQQISHQSSRPWLIPVVIAVAAALLLGGIGVVIGLLAQQKSAPPTSTGPAGVSTVALPAPTNRTEPPSPPPAPVPQSAVRPPLVLGRDSSESHESCDDGFSLRNAAGFGSHAGRGTAETSCFFAGSVLSSYWNQYGGASRDARTVSAPGKVDCRSVGGAQCDGPNFVMQCAAYGSDGWITCTGGRNAKVYLY
ncbi:serine/threonine-protein kinase [Mycolicibacterium komossense]|uniref:non-specific serine/threonine protein kinase n=1 Tax=Mycolicibacterium komossense TaxID=1779 RepID=A0ABT3CHZ3_9MYCO|nr:serine/threonine-protein kinase [Mycolicibacterium komossense]MCV7229075.1 serine/threonine protein kinase [Mycolicibacterium komossense]